MFVRAQHVAVIGPGPSGLVALKTLREHGLEATAYEAGDRVGGHWVLGNSSGTSAAYYSLRTNTNKAMSRYADFSLPDDLPQYPRHDQMADWFESYVDHFGFRDRIRCGTRVAKALRREGGGWRLQLSGGGHVEHDALVVASGNLWDPHWPEFEGRFEGPMIHAKEYMDPRDPVDWSGRRVLVVGLGTTACELAVELAEPGVAGQVFLAARSGQTILPRISIAVPHPSEPLGGVLRWLPPPLRERAFAEVFPRMMGRMLAKLPRPEHVGLPPAPTKPLAKRVVINDDVIPLCRDGAIRPKPAIRRLVGDKVEFADGSSEEIDGIVLATGYQPNFSFLREAVPELEQDGVRLAWGVRHPEHADLFVIGVMRAVCSIWPRSEQQMRFVAPFLAGEAAWPSRRAVERASYPVLGVPFGNCQIHTAMLQRELGRGRRRARLRAWRRRRVRAGTS